MRSFRTQNSGTVFPKQRCDYYALIAATLPRDKAGKQAKEKCNIEIADAPDAIVV